MTGADKTTSTDNFDGAMKFEGRCYSHKDRVPMPWACQTCMRICVEQTVVERVIDLLAAQGFTMWVLDEHPRGSSQTKAALMEMIFDLDDAHLMVSSGSAPVSWVYFVRGNDGYDVVSDYTTNLEQWVSEISKFTDTLA